MRAESTQMRALVVAAGVVPKVDQTRHQPPKEFDTTNQSNLTVRQLSHDTLHACMHARNLISISKNKL